MALQSQERLPPKHRFAGVGFSFFTDEEIQKLSVTEIINPIAFDHLNNPTKQGLHDKRLGVSAFDHKSNCPTCGMQVHHCPGHVGHINLTAPLYNPFLVKEVYKLLKAKCFACHHIRINPSKIEAYTSILKLLKIGEVVQSATLKQYLLYAATSIDLVSASTLVDKKKLAQMKNNIVNMAPAGQQDCVNVFKCDSVDLPNVLQKIEASVNENKEVFEQNLRDQLQNVLNQPMPLALNTTTQKRLLELHREIWQQVVTTTCPHCKHKSPSVKKDGFTKMFIKPLASKSQKVLQQKKNIRSSSLGLAEIDEDLDETTKLENATNASTVGGTTQSRKHSSGERSLLTDRKSVQSEPSEHQEESSEDEEYREGTAQQFITSLEVRDHIEKMWAKEHELLGLMFGKYDPSMPNQTDSLGYKQFFIEKVVVPPQRFRPESEGNLGGASSGQDRAYLHTHSAMLMKVIQKNISLSEALIEQSKRENDRESAAQPAGQSVSTQIWIQLQDAVNTFMDSSMAQKTVDRGQPGIRQLLERKEGMFRMKMMGKRVNFGGRSVISPDPYITTDQIGVPVFMAKKLTFPESVSAVNYRRLRKCVINGASIHPGANIVEDEQTGIQLSLRDMTDEEREGIANQLQVGRKIVHRHLATGDVLLVNRQPTLHKPSIMAHIARILPKEQTIRMHYANCSTYNADFDGDEMNIHFPQSYQAASEAYKLMATHKQYVVPTSGKPIRGLIQDSVVSGVFLSSKDTFLSKEQYMQLVYIGVRELVEQNLLKKIKTLPPAVMKPKTLWTGKQVISTILKNIVISGMTEKQRKRNEKICGLNFDSKARLAAKEWGEIGKEEGEVIFRDNEHLQGTLDKNQFGAQEQGLVHSFYELYGSEKAGELLTALARVFVANLQTHGFTCGLDDLLLKPAANKQRRETIEQSHQQGLIEAAKFSGAKNPVIPKSNFSNRVVFQSEGKKDPFIEELTNMALPENPFTDAKKCIQLDNQICAALEDKIGQSLNNKEALEVELDNVIKGVMSKATSEVLKGCIPSGLIKRFPRNNISAMVLTGAKGGVVNQTQISALLGQQELEGRRVPKMQNGKTLPCYLEYDPNPRSSGYVSDRFISGLRPQDFFFHCMAGREGLIDTAVKTSRSGYLQRCLIKQLESLVVSYDLTVRDNDGSIVQFLYGEDGVDVMNTKFLDKFRFLERNQAIIMGKHKSIIDSGVLQIEPIEKAKKEIRREAKVIYSKQKSLGQEKAKELALLRFDPLLSRFHPQKHFGAVPEKLEAALQKYIKKDSISKEVKNQGDHALSFKFPLIEPEEFKKLFYLKYMRSVAHAGENVGTIAAQSIGEPSTQMTLNTFHLAGHGAANMTLGIPRLKEILMTTPTNIKTPCMTVFFKPNQEMTLEKMQKFAKSFERIRLQEVVKEIKLAQSIEKASDGTQRRIYKLYLVFEEAQLLLQKLGVSFSHLCKVFADKFVPMLMTETLKNLRKAAELDIGAVKAMGEDAPNKDLKEQLSKTTKATKLIKGQKVLNPDEIDEVMDEKHGETKEADADSDDDGRKSDEVMDIDGIVKQNVRYDQQESNSEVDSQLLESDFEQGPDEAEEAQRKADDNLNALKNAFREKNSKYLQFMRGDFDCVQNESISVTLQFPLEYKKLLLLTLAETCLQKVLIRNIQGIEKCTLVQPRGAEPYLFVQGINFAAFEKYDSVCDLRRIRSNHSYALKERYGIEACRANISKEINAVFDVYGIAVDQRHLSLIADFITFNGDYRAFNRQGMEESSSPFLKMSFETTMKYLVQSSVNRDVDWIKSPSSALVLGTVPAVGTNSFDLIQNVISQRK